MRFAVANDILRQVALGQQGIGGTGFVLDIDGIEQRDGGLDFVGALEFIASRYGQGTDFF